MKICFLVGTLGPGGLERQLFYILKTLKLNGHSLFVLSLTKGDFWESRISELGIPVIWVGKPTSRILRLLLILMQIMKISPQIIHSQSFHTNLYASVVGFLLRKKVIGSLRNDVYSEIESAGVLGHLCFHLPPLLAANSQAGIFNALTLGKPPSQLFFLPNVVDETHFSTISRKGNGRNLQVIFVGTMRGPKKVDRIISIAKKCLELNLKIEFRLFGNGELKSSLEELAKNIGVLDMNLRFMGSVDDSLIAYQDADVLLLTSAHEGTPNVVLEAMSCGLPIISTRVGDVDRYIQDGVNGFIVDPPDEEDKFVERLIQLSSSGEITVEMGQRNRKIIEDKASLNSLYNSLMSLYSIIMKQRKHIL